MWGWDLPDNQLDLHTPSIFHGVLEWAHRGGSKHLEGVMKVGVVSLVVEETVLELNDEVQQDVPAALE